MAPTHSDPPDPLLHSNPAILTRTHPRFQFLRLRASGFGRCNRFGRRNRFSLRGRRRRSSRGVHARLTGPRAEETGGGGVDGAGVAGEEGTNVGIAVAGGLHRVGQVADDLVVRGFAVREEFVGGGAEFGRVAFVGRAVLAVVDDAFEDLAFEVVNGGGDGFQVGRAADFAGDGFQAACGCVQQMCFGLR